MRLKPIALLAVAALSLTSLGGCYSYGNKYAQEVGDPYPGHGEGGGQAAQAANAGDSTTAAPPPSIDVASLPELRLNVAEIQVVPGYAASGQKPNVEQMASPTPQQAAEAWAKSKVKAVGTQNRAMVIIRQASIVEVPLPTKKGLEGVFTKEPDRRYDGTLEAEIEIRNDTGKKIASAEARALRTQSVVQGTSEADLKALWAKMSRDLAGDLAAEFDKQVHAHLATYVK
ncbi:MAG: hypothetical protein ACM3N5_07345 [Candidatus Eiseniibacteriota bacterium]